MCGRRAFWRTGCEYPAHAFDGLEQAGTVAEDGDEAPQVVGGVARAVARDEPLDPFPGPACQVGLDTGDGDHRWAGHPRLDLAWSRLRMGSRRSAPAQGSPVRVRRIEVDNVRQHLMVAKNHR